MCGIVGIITKNANGFGMDECELFTNMLQMDTIRGKDSTGVFGVDVDSKIDIIKADTDGWTFTQCQNYKAFENKIYSTYRIVIGHNRAATKGAVTAANAHPFKEEHISLVHNGTIYNKDDLDKSVDVDSHAITKALAKTDAAEALESIHGPFALVWYDTKLKSLNLARNSERPLFLIEYPNYWTVSSEPGLPYWLNGRENKKAMGMPKLIPTKKIVQINIDNLRAGFSEIEYENYSYMPPPMSYRPPTYSYPPSPLKSVPYVGTHSLPFKQGDSVTFKVDDIKHEEDDTDYIIFGHPMFEDEIDTNILVKTDTKLKHEADAMVAAGFAQGTLTSITDMGGMPVLYMRFAEPVRKDANENLNTDRDIMKAIANGCSRCKGTMVFTDISDSIVRQKKDGSYRILCSKCLKESKDKVPNTGSLLAH